MNIDKIIATLIERNLTIGSIESFTGGLFGAKIVDYPGVSKIYKGTIVAYSEDIKKQVVKVSPNVLEKYGAVSSKVALEMARKGQTLLESDYCFAFTGNAGPATNDEDIVGDVFIALVYGDVELLEHLRIDGDRAKVRNDAVLHAFKMLERVLENAL